VAFVWTNEQQESFEMLKKLLISNPLLAHPQWDKTFKMQTDASEVAVGIILCQEDDEGYEHSIAFHSRKFGQTERTWHVRDREAFAIV
jgi:hypothetical protein